LHDEVLVPSATTRRPRVPVATYRLQFNSRFRFTDARAITDYLDALGITDCYASSYLKAVPGSPHGYDVADPTRLNPEIGTDEHFESWIDELRSRGMGHVLDLVPNHMGIAKSSNPWWQDVLENGPSSRYARFFDIEWHPVKAELADKVLIPILGDQYGAALERRELVLNYRDGAFLIEYGDQWLPIAPDTYPRILRADLDEGLGRAGAGVGTDVDELRSVMTAADNLPPRSSRDPEAIGIRARDKEVVKRRLAAVVARSEALQRLIALVLTRFGGVAGNPRSFDALDTLLNQQSYRLAHWRVASEEINYRRFFDVNELAALRMEDPEVFEEVHRFAFELMTRGVATGLRVDHVDGLFSPGDYLRRLEARAADADRPMYLVVEKILGPDEQLPPDWPVHGTTGYEFASVVNGLFVDRRSERAFDDLYVRFTRQRRHRPSFDDLVYQSKKQVVHATMSGDINWLGHQLNRFSERNRHFRDFTLYSLISALKEVIACFPVYRTYVTAGDEISDHDRRYVARAIRSANRRAPGVTSLVFDFIQRVLLKQTAVSTTEECEERARFIGKFQQLSSPVAAKGIEDTALYVYNRLLSLNEIGSDPTCFGLEPAAVHQWMADRRQQWPHALSATATHDTKRGEDVRARLNVLSEMPDAWKAAVTRWRALNRRFKTEVDGVAAPDPNEEYFLYQTLIGAWPFDKHAQEAFEPRVKNYLVKALREAKVNTSWLAPNEAYEAAALGFVERILDRRRPFLQAFLPFQSRIAELAIYNSLAQLVIKIAAPGVPDFYQGTELWDLSLVDPDNRRPVDYSIRRGALDALDGSDERGDQSVLRARADGRIKMFVMHGALRTRAEIRSVFECGSYVPLSTSRDRSANIFAFARRHQGVTAIACVPRLIVSLVGDRPAPPVGRGVWRDTTIELPEPKDAASRWPSAFRDTFTGETVSAQDNGGAMAIAAAEVFSRFPVALLVGEV
jgi:(1->4)-alpha-D-glucan 1-alpha-D-glucosylmutase